MSRRFLVAVYCILGGVALYGVLLPPDALIWRVLYEDCFYYLKIAQNVVAGAGVTLDGVEPTNGFHPLWMLLCVFAEAVSSRYALNIILFAGVAAHLLQCVLIYKIVSSRGSRGVAHAAAIFWLVSYRVWASNVCGLETPLVTLMVCACIYMARSRLSVSFKSSVLFGCLLGLTVLSRFDALLLLGVLLAWASLASEGRWSLRLRNAVVMGMASLLTVLPWFLWSRSASGVLLPNSRAALSLVRGHGISMQPSFWESLVRQIKVAVYWLPDTANAFGLYPLALPSMTVAYVLSIVMFLLLAVLTVLGVRMVSGKDRAFIVMLSSFVWLHVGYYSICAYPEVRYLLPACSAIVVLAACLAVEASKRYQRAWVRKALISGYVLLLASSVCAGVSAWSRHQGATRTHVAHRELLETARSLHLSLGRDAVVGSWNAGIMSYYSRRTVVNLDGCVNDSALAANAKGELCSYLDERGVTHLVDFYSDIFNLMDKYGGNPLWRDDYMPVMTHKDGRVVVLERRRLSNQSDPDITTDMDAIPGRR